MARAVTWRTLEPEPLSRGSLEALCRAEIPAIRVDTLLDGAECDAVMRALPGGGFERYARHRAFRRFERIGIAQGGYGASQRDAYLEAAVRARAERDELVRASGIDPLARAMERLRIDGGADVSVAREADGREYFAGIVRRINEGVELHADSCRRTDPRWQIHASVAQLSLNIYLTAFDGGACIVHERLREEADDATVPRGSYVYARALVAGARAARLQPHRGELLLFNSRCFHEVEPATSDRVTLAAFVGQLRDGRFIVWA
jgi:hypothetical protein